MRFKAPLILLTTFALAGCGAIGGQTPAPLPTVVLGSAATPAASASASAPSGSAITASGRVAAAQQAQLAFAGVGQVLTLTVAEGDQVQAGQVIASLGSADRLAAAAAATAAAAAAAGVATAGVAAAQSEILGAQQALKDLQDNAALASAQAHLAVAQAQLAVAEAQAALTKANKDLHNVQNPAGPTLQDVVDKAKLALDTAKNNALLNNVSPDAQALVQATAQVNILFSAYQNLQAKWDAGDHSDGLQKALTLAQSAYQAALDNKTQLELRIQTAQANGNQSVKDAQKAYDDAVNNQAAAQRGPDADKLAVAQGTVTVAQAALEQSQAALAQAQTREAALKNGPDPDVLAAGQQRLVAAQAQLAAAQAQLAAAQAQLAAAQTSLDDLDLKASIGGTVTELRIHQGEWVTPGQPVVVLTDLAHLQVETTDLSERDVSQVSLGQSVSVLIKPLNQTIAGKVTKIASLADTLGGDVVYKTTIELASLPAGLRAGMSVDVQFLP